MITSVFSIKQPLKFFTILVHAPPRPSPWFDEEIRRLINNKNEVYRQYIRNGKLQQLQHRNSLTFTSNSLREVLKSLKEQYYSEPSNRLNNPFTSTKIVWTMLNPFTSVGRYIGLTLLCQKCSRVDISAVNTCVRKTYSFYCWP